MNRGLLSSHGGWRTALAGGALRTQVLGGAPGARGRDGRFEVVVSPALLSELERVLAYPKLRKRIPREQAEVFLAYLESNAEIAGDRPATVRTADPDDDDLIGLAQHARAAIVSGDRHLLDLADRLPIFTAPDWLEPLDG